MGTPRKRQSHSRTRKRRSHDHLNPTCLVDPVGGQVQRRRKPHEFDLENGIYAAGQRRPRRIVKIEDEVEDGEE